MAFTRWECLRGAVAAWIAFLVIAPVVHVAVSLLADEVTRPDGLAALLDMLTYFLVLWLWFATSVILPWSFGALLILGLPLATALGLALRGVQDRRIHVVLFALLGAAVGLATTLVFAAVNPVPYPWGTLLSAAWVNTIVCTACVAAGWWYTAARALRADAESSPGSVMTSSG